MYMRHGNCALCSVNKPISLNKFFKQLLLELGIFFETSNTFNYYFNVVIGGIERKSWAMKKERIKLVWKIWWKELTNGRATNSFKRYLVTGEGPGD